MEKVLLTVPEACKVLSISRSQIYRLVARRELYPVHIGRSIRIPVVEIERWLQAQITIPQDGSRYPLIPENIPAAYVRRKKF